MKLIVKTLRGAEGILGNELERLGATNVEIQKKAVACEADKEVMYRICYCSRLAIRVIANLIEFEAQNENDLYDHTFNYDWHKLISPDATIFIDHVSYGANFGNSQYAALKIKDAIVDQIREKCGRRPYVSDENPDVVINVFISDEKVIVGLDAVGAPLWHRGYRGEVFQNTTGEVLAAALVELSGWKPTQHLIDPMCGCGTICIEAAMKARNIPAAAYRKYDFCFQHTLDYDEALWQKVKDEANAKRNNIRLNIVGSDIDTEALDIARMTTIDMGLSSEVRISRRGIREQARMTQEGVIVTCLPFLPEETRRELSDFYKEAAYYLSHNFPDHDVWFYSTNLEALDGIEFQAEKKIELYDGSQPGSMNLYPF